jgi:hypothetical protein
VKASNNTQAPKSKKSAFEQTINSGISIFVDSKSNEKN